VAVKGPKHFSIKRGSRGTYTKDGEPVGLYRLVIITAFKDRHEITVTGETLSVMTRILMPKFSPSFQEDENA